MNPIKKWLVFGISFGVITTLILTILVYLQFPFFLTHIIWTMEYSLGFLTGQELCSVSNQVACRKIFGHIGVLFINLGIGFIIGAIIVQIKDLKKKDKSITE